jgi:hypothetical protein
MHVAIDGLSSSTGCPSLRAAQEFAALEVVLQDMLDLIVRLLEG